MTGSTLESVEGRRVCNSPMANYDRRGEEVKCKAIKTLHVPYHRKDKATK